MRAYELHGVNDLRREDIEKPEIPSGWVLVQVKASGICSSDIPRIFTNGTYHFQRFRVTSFQAWLPHTARVCRKSELETGRHFPADPMPHLPAVPTEKI